MLPSDFPMWRSVHAYFQKWSETKDGQPSTLETVLKKLVGEARLSNGRTSTTSFLIIDAQSVTNTDTAKERGYDAGKKVSGIKRHIAVDTNGLPHAIHVTTANVSDRAGAITLAEAHKDTLRTVTNLLVDGGYTGENFANEMKRILDMTVEVVKRNELHTFNVLPKRWVVERILAGLRSVADSGSIVNANSTRAYRWSVGVCGVIAKEILSWFTYNTCIGSQMDS
jgi:transposase